jgi:flagellar biosynthetic protein FliR
MPQMQVFFIAMPASIILGFALLALVLAAMMGVYLSYVEQGLNVLLQRT